MPVPGLPTPPDYFVAPPDFAGHVVHTIVRTHEDHEPAGAIDDISESWFRFGADGSPDLVHIVTTSMTGTPLGEQLLTPTGGQSIPVMIGGQPTPPPFPTPLDGIPRPLTPAPCPQSANLISPVGSNPLTAMLPTSVPFVIPARYAAAVHLAQGKPRAPSKQPPALPPVPGATPLTSYKPDRTITPWEWQGPSGSGTEESQVVETGSAGRMEYFHFRNVTAQGRVVDEIERVYGEVDVYAASAVPADAFTFSGKACKH